VHDGIEFDKRGVPAAAIITHIFTTTGKAMAEIDSVPDYPFLIVPHPLSSLTEQELRGRAAALVPAIARVLLKGEGGEVIL
jgi:hypothetical protein